MRATLHRVLVTLAAGRPPMDVAIRIYVAFLLMAALYACGCVFLLMEPLA